MFVLLDNQFGVNCYSHELLLAKSEIGTRGVHLSPELGPPQQGAEQEVGEPRPSEGRRHQCSWLPVTGKPSSRAEMRGARRQEHSLQVNYLAHNEKLQGQRLSSLQGAGWGCNMEMQLLQTEPHTTALKEKGNEREKGGSIY